MSNKTSSLNSVPSLWIITEGLKGTENQCLGVAEMLGLNPIIKKVMLRQPWKLLSPYLGFETDRTFLTDSKESIASPYPDILITGGRKAIAASRYIKKKSLGKTFTLHILDPRISPKHFDLVAIPEHDKTRGENVILTKATPNRISVRTLQEGRQKFPEFGQLDSPRIAVLIGGNSKAYQFDKETAQTLIARLKTLQQTHNASLMITMSRRTPKDIAHMIRTSLGGDKSYIWDEVSENPYFGFLAWADMIIATSDSTSMLSEACTTGKPTYMIPLKEISPARRIKNLQDNLIKHGGLRVFDGTLEAWHYTPLNDAQLVANELKKRLPDYF